MSRGYTVYRVDRVTGAKEPIGCLMDRRDKESRSYSRSKLVVEARLLFGLSKSDFIRIVVEYPEGAHDLGETTMAYGVVTIRSGKRPDD